MQWLQHPNQSHVVNLNNVRHESRRHFRNKKEYQKAKIDDLETNSKISIETCIGESMILRRATSLVLI
jgi:hypothetical protein